MMALQMNQGSWRNPRQQQPHVPGATYTSSSEGQRSLVSDTPHPAVLKPPTAGYRSRLQHTPLIL